jgi:hypothetical protein
MRSDDAAESGTALVSSVMKPIALTKSSPDALGAGRTAVGLRLLKPERARAGKEESSGFPRTVLLGPCLLIGFLAQDRLSSAMHNPVSFLGSAV